MSRHNNDKKICAVCGEKAGIFTRIKLNDGLLCGDCVKKCSEHLEDFDDITADEIRKHLEYRKRNKQSDMLNKFNITMALGDFEVLKIDENNGYWMLTTPKRYVEENPDVFYLSQVTQCEVIEKKELFAPAVPDEEEPDDEKSKLSVEEIKKIKKKFQRKSRPAEYGYWFYLRISVHHPCFSQIVMRINKYIIRESDQFAYVSTKRQSEKICETFEQLCIDAKEKYGEK